MIGLAPTFSVSGFVAVFNQSLDMLYPEVVITGELANFKISKNMWVYFDLKDESASVKFFGTTRALPGPLEDGMLLEVVGRPYLHPQFGFSVQVSTVQAVGTGSINKAYLLLQKQLEKEGLFDPARKRDLPYAPDSIALVASEESAAYGDFIKVSKARWPYTQIILFNVQVQGKDAPSQIAEAITRANQSSGIDALVMIRGGGSKDDMAAFDHETVVRAVAGSRLPTLVAIGHERDIALSELAADARASTPSNAAEMILPDRNAERNWLIVNIKRMDDSIFNYSDQLQREVAEYEQLFDNQLMRIFDHAGQYKHIVNQLLQAYDPKQLLQRGYTLARDEVGRVITDTKSAKKAGSFSLEFKDDIINVDVRS